MRPLHGNDTSTAGRRDAHLAMSSAANNNHMSFFITDEASLDLYLGQGSATHARGSKKTTGPSRTGDGDHSGDDVPSSSPSLGASPFPTSPVSPPSRSQPSFVSRPITPITLGPSCVGSTGSILSSRRNSLASSLSDHATSYGQESTGELASIPGMTGSGSIPQLVMPSISMPSRRPFTETGKSLGHLKILLAGDHDVGKTSLLKAIVQACDHIVHIDAILSPAKLNQAILSMSSRRELLSTTTISEIYASTRPYPGWWQELDMPYLSRKRKRRGDDVLERNICFVDTPGYGRGPSAMETILSCVDYVESHLRKVSSNDLSDSDLMNMLSGDGGCQVDVVLYLISHRGLKPADLEYIRRLVPMTNVIPVLARTELLSEKQIAASKQDIVGQLESAGIQPFTFTSRVALGSRGQSMPSIPYTVSSAMVSDYDVMDASLLMSPDYAQPLTPTDLVFLVEKIFSLEGAAWLRHSAASKYLQWRELAPHRPHDLYRPLAPSVPDHQLALAPLSLALARRAGPQRGSGMTQVQVVDWATELQRSLASDRLRYEALCRGERAVWLTEKLHECVRDGTLVTANSRQGARDGDVRRTRNGRYKVPGTQQHQDPLGLLQVAADLKAKGWVAVEIFGSLGIVGLALWMSGHGWPRKAVELIDEWIGF
ncbi:putative heat shock protein [Rosellinia necatrix]|uniref:Putative heat shock protein n=1 Tax=Rosellinia necatrix TaxID=77044 RepID=A0A1W2TNN7_ROSNE|nr:putative heat shock protein [Rosellinia necatrix]